MKHPLPIVALFAVLIASLTVLGQGPVVNTQPSMQDLIERRVDNITTNNYITAADGRVTVYSATVKTIRGVNAILNQNNKVRSFSVVSSPTNQVTLQVWMPNGTKQGVETNSYIITVFK